MPLAFSPKSGAFCDALLGRTQKTQTDMWQPVLHFITSYFRSRRFPQPPIAHPALATLATGKSMKEQAVGGQSPTPMLHLPASQAHVVVPPGRTRAGRKASFHFFCSCHFGSNAVQQHAGTHDLFPSPI